MVHSFLGGGISAQQKEQLSQISPQDASESPHAESLEESLKAYLSKKLPRYMVPNIYVKLSRMPLTANGKINRKGLPRPDLSKQTTEFVAPSNELERRLIELVQTLFDVERVSLTDDFYDLGVNSLDMVQLYNAIKAEFQREITITDIFNHTTAKELSELINHAPAEISAQAPLSNTIPTSALNPEQVDMLLSGNIDNLSDAEVELLLAKLEQEQG